METENIEKERGKSGLCYMAKYGGAKTLVCQVKGQRIVKIYEARDFVEISKTEFYDIVKAMKESD